MTLSRPCSLNHLFLLSLEISKKNVVANGIPEKIDILKHHADIFQQAVASKFSHLYPDDCDTALTYIVKTSDRPAQSRLSTARRPHNCRCLSLRYRKI